MDVSLGLVVGLVFDFLFDVSTGGFYRAPIGFARGFHYGLL